MSIPPRPKGRGFHRHIFMKKKITIKLELDNEAWIELYQALCSEYNLIPTCSERGSPKEKSLGRCLVEVGKKLKIAGSLTNKSEESKRSKYVCGVDKHGPWCEGCQRSEEVCKSRNKKIQHLEECPFLQTRGVRFPTKHCGAKDEDDLCFATEFRYGGDHKKCPHFISAPKHQTLITLKEKSNVRQTKDS